MTASNKGSVFPPVMQGGLQPIISTMAIRTGSRLFFGRFLFGPILVCFSPACDFADHGGVVQIAIAGGHRLLQDVPMDPGQR